MNDEAWCVLFNEEIIMSETCNCEGCWAYDPDKDFICIHARDEEV